MSSQRSSVSIPDGWLNCPRKSDGLIASKFLVFKTPLSDAYTNQMALEHIFLPEMLFGYCKTLKIKIGLWIDCTNTEKYYDRSVIEANGAQYVKFKCRGIQGIPSRQETRSFKEIVNNFILKRPSDIIGVHCVHGFNCTGFLITSYLIENCNYTVKTALSTFSDARSPGIYKQGFIDELCRRYGEKENIISAPKVPDWHNKINTSGRAEKRKFEEICQNTKMDNGHNGSQNKRQRQDVNAANATFMAGVTGVVSVQDQPRLTELQIKLKNMCGCDRDSFPGAQFVPMDDYNLNHLSEKPYRVSWKTDGKRCMMLINRRNEIYLFDQNNSCFQVQNLSFVKSCNLNEHLEDTLVDGEMVLDKYQGNVTPRFLINDVVYISNFNIGELPFFPDRLNCIKKEIIDPRNTAIERGIIHRPSESFGVRHKEFHGIRKASLILDETFLKSLSHKQDGLIFQPSKEPYTSGTYANILHWRPIETNTLDFVLRIYTEKDVEIIKRKVCQLFVGGHNRPYAYLPYREDLEHFHNQMVECKLNANDQWEFVRGSDRKRPSNFKLAEYVTKGIVGQRDRVTQNALLHFIKNYGLPDEDEENSEPYFDIVMQQFPQLQEDRRDHLFPPPRRIFD